MGSYRLRDGALSNSKVINYINKELIPVWVDVREQPFPVVPAIKDQDWELALGEERQVTSPLFYFYFVRSFVVGPDLRTWLNRSSGRWAQIQPHAKEYLRMLRRAVAKWRANKA